MRPRRNDKDLVFCTASNDALGPWPRTPRRLKVARQSITDTRSYALATSGFTKSASSERSLAFVKGAILAAGHLRFLLPNTEPQ